MFLLCTRTMAIKDITNLLTYLTIRNKKEHRRASSWCISQINSINKNANWKGFPVYMTPSVSKRKNIQSKLRCHLLHFTILSFFEVFTSLFVSVKIFVMWHKINTVTYLWTPYNILEIINLNAPSGNLNTQLCRNLYF